MTPEASPQPSWEMRAAFATSAAPIAVASAATDPAPGTGASVARSSRRASRDSERARPRFYDCCKRRRISSSSRSAGSYPSAASAASRSAMSALRNSMSASARATMWSSERLVDGQGLVQPDERRVGLGLLVSFLQQLLARAGTDPIDAEPARELRDPGADGRVVAKLVEILVDPREALLEDVLGVGLGQAKGLHRDPVDVSGETLDQLAPGVLVPCAAARDELRIGRGGLHGPPIKSHSLCVRLVRLRLGVLGNALAEGVGLVLVRAVLGLERDRVKSALCLAGLGGVDRRLLLLILLRLRLLRNALAERVGLVLVRAVEILEGLVADRGPLVTALLLRCRLVRRARVRERKRRDGEQ